MAVFFSNPTSGFQELHTKTSVVMDDYEATRIVFSRVQNLDPENASKIMGLLLLQDHGEKDMIRLAFGPEALIHSLILKARNDLNLHSVSVSNSSSSSSSSSSSFRQAFGSSRNPYPNPDEFLISPNNLSVRSSSSSSLPPYGNGGADMMIDEFQFQFQDQLSFLNDGSTAENHPDFYYPPSDLSSSPTGGDLLFAAAYGGSGGSWSDDSSLGLGWRPCLYYARGYCKNGGSCRFSHSGGVDSGLNLNKNNPMVPSDGAAVVGSPGGRAEIMEQCNDHLLRSKSALQQRLAAASSNCNFPYSMTPSDLFLQQQQNEIRRASAAGLSMAEETSNPGTGRFRAERNEFPAANNPAARQIYLTFPADSCFKEEDVSKYFSIYGPVEDVRIPYQQKRMFGFVTFVFPETVKLILAKGNPHFVCDSRVLVKPYKEKGKLPDKFRKQQMERGDFSPCGTPTPTTTSVDSRELHDLHLGGRTFYNNQEMLLRRKLEKQALELQTLRVMSLQLVDLKKPPPHHHQHHHHHHNPFNQPLILPSIPQVLQEKGLNRLPEIRVELQVLHGADSAADSDSSTGKETSLEHNLPDSPFASASYARGGIEGDDSDASTEKHSAASSFVSTSNLGASFKSFNCQYSSGHGAIGLYTSTGGPTCRVGI